MLITHLNCGSLRPAFGLGTDPTAHDRRLVCHCLLLESDDRLVLVDTGLGTGDVTDPRRLPGRFRRLVRPDLALAETALHQVRALGHDPERVTDIVQTHLDCDHAGGLGDFPWATVHLAAEALTAVREPASPAMAGRTLPAQLAHGPRFRGHEFGAQRWHGWPAVAPIPELAEQLLLVDLPGHLPGHAGVAVRRPTGSWLLHAGDAAMHRSAVDPTAPPMPRATAWFERKAALDPASFAQTRAGLRRLADVGVDVVFSHDAVQYERCVASVSRD